MTKTSSPLEGRAGQDRNGALRLIDAAEALLGRHGIDGASMRQIQLAAGSGNKYAVQYHFGGIPGLIEAILTRRMAVVDARQAELLDDVLDGDTPCGVRTLIEVFFTPLLEQVDADGERVYARFVSALLRSVDGEKHYRQLLHLTPTARRITELLHGILEDIHPAVLQERLRLIIGMVCSSVFNRHCSIDDTDADARLVNDALDIAAAGLIGLNGRDIEGQPRGRGLARQRSRRDG